jgi:predicted phage terminase large subunit-like protein
MTKADEQKWKEILDRTNGDEELTADIYVRWKCTTDLYFLATEVLGLSQAKEGKRSRFDPKWHKWLAGRLNENKDSLILVPRGHMKSTMLKIKVIQLILQNPMIRIGLFSRTAGLVEEQLSDIKRLMATPLLRRYFPELIPDPGPKYNGWQKATINQLTTRRHSDWGRIPQEEMIEAWGMGATITGRHYDVLVLDDIINEQSISTPEQMQKVRDYYSYLQAIKEPDGFELIVGTRYHYSDIYGVIIKEDFFGRRVWTRKAIEDGKPIYKFFTPAMLNRIRRRVGAYVWACQFENNPIPKELQIFPPPYPEFEHLPGGRYDYYMTVDPAATTKSYSDYTAIVVTALDSKNRLFVVEGQAHKKPGNEIAEIIVSLIVKYKPRRVGIEYGLQTALGYIIEAKKIEYQKRTGESVGAHIVPIKIPRHISKESRIERSLGSFLRDGRIFIHQSLNELKSQMEQFPRGEHDDLPDALSMQFRLIEKFRGVYWDNQIAPVESRGRSFFDVFGEPSEEPSGAWEAQFVS